ncbi:hypothetical protein [Xanthomonas sp. WHRI 7945]|nr:hypothetical protein [Xanthomonas campestris pv. campestris]
MAWIPIYTSGVDYQFDPSGTFSTATLGTDSIIRGVNVGGALGHWELTLTDAADVRVTTLSYSDNSISDPAFFTWEPGSVAVVNQDQSELPTSFLPSPFTVGPATSLRFDFGYYEQAGSFEFLIEVQTDAPEPPAPVGPVYVVPHHLRAYSGYDSPLTLWVRDEVGRADLSQDVVSVVVSTYQGNRQLYRRDATASAAGEVTWIHPANIAGQHRPGVYRFKVVSSLRGVIGDGLLEVV